ncbi:MAG: hypothetical protein AAF806_16665, partial [Bacteroidota bacterium]
NDPNYLEALTPTHFLIGKSQIPSRICKRDDKRASIEALATYPGIIHPILAPLAQGISYISSAEREMDQRDQEIGSGMVLVIEDNQLPFQWPLAPVKSLPWK